MIRSRGSVLIIVMWLIMLGLILVTAMAVNIRLSATTVINYNESLHSWSRILASLNKAHMELLINQMPAINVRKTSSFKKTSEENSFDGRALKLSYPGSDGMTIRIMDLSGKLNISGLNEIKIKQFLEHNLGEYNKNIPLMSDAWLDWIDKDDLKRLNGAERQYYKKNNLSYQPRNDNFMSVDEIRLIKGFDEVFKDIDLETVLTLYGKSGTVNPNFASAEVLKMLPGMSEEAAKELIAARKIQPFKNMSEVSIHLSPSVISKVSGWMNFKKSDYYTIIIHADTLKDERSVYAYVEEVKVNNFSKPPTVLRVIPYAKVNIEQ
ncbi:MAG: general secretion pathway protein GspK [gamma proteobacterium symbiont of Taylorina sp.]|nr:general secretion pathway protein GspK [gamma proteobacterium symbiont of Taylorina sp.]